MVGPYLAIVIGCDQANQSAISKVKVQALEKPLKFIGCRPIYTHYSGLGWRHPMCSL